METQVDEDVTALVGLLNSRKFSVFGDKLDSPATAGEVLRPFGQVDDVPSAERIDLVRAVRSDLVALIGAPDSAEDWAAFSRRVSSATFRQDFATPGEVALCQVDGDPVVGRITVAVAGLVAAGNWSRLHMCANQRCQEVFYDTTRSRTRRWHSYEMCGNRTNVAAYRARHG